MIITGTLPAANGHVMIRQIVDLWVQHFPVSIVSDVTSAGTRTIVLAVPFTANRVHLEATSLTSTAFTIRVPRFPGRAFTFRSEATLSAPYHYRLLTNSTGGAYVQGESLQTLFGTILVSTIPPDEGTFAVGTSQVEISTTLDSFTTSIPSYTGRLDDGRHIFTPIYFRGHVANRSKNNPTPNVFVSANPWGALSGEIVSVGGRNFLNYGTGGAGIILIGE